MRDRLEDRRSGQQQQQVLLDRLKALEAGASRDKQDRLALEALARLSELRAAAAIISQGNGRFVAAYVLQRVGKGGHRYLEPGAEWRLRWARDGMAVILVPTDLQKLFSRLVRYQELCQRAILDLRRRSEGSP